MLDETFEQEKSIRKIENPEYLFIETIKILFFFVNSRRLHLKDLHLKNLCIQVYENSHRIIQLK